jgi:hypothetical protein
VPEEVGDSTAGYALRPPEGWDSLRQEGRIILGPPQGDVFVMAIPHAASGWEELAPLAEEGWKEPGLELDPAGSPVSSEDRVRLPLAGLAEGDEVQAQLLVLFGPSSGGLILLGVAREESAPGLAETVEVIAGSVRFTEPDTEELLAGWKGALRGKRLIYLYTYSSPGPGGGPAGGFTERHEIVLGSDGAFEQSGDFSVAVEGGGGGEVRGPTTGTWEIVAAAGQALLELRWDPESATYILSLGQESGEALLNGRRYFVTEP